IICHQLNTKNNIISGSEVSRLSVAIQMSKIGPPQLRARLYMSALCGKIYNKRMRNIYDEMCLRGKPKMVAIGALMRKLVHWCYGVLKTGTVFNDEGLKQVLST
ncbi:hypothetical protein ACOICU_25090, partial [Klebsiella pneumoniae]